jgi:hypothetical protein
VGGRSCVLAVLNHAFITFSSLHCNYSVIPSASLITQHEYLSCLDTSTPNAIQALTGSSVFKTLSLVQTYWSRHVLLHEERLALVLQCLEVEVQVGELATWVLLVAFMKNEGSDGLTGCTVWTQVDEAAVYVPLTQIHRSTHCVHLCGNGCSSEVVPGEMVFGDQAVGLIGEHDLIRNPCYLLNEHFLR